MQIRKKASDGGQQICKQEGQMLVNLPSGVSTCKSMASYWSTYFFKFSVWSILAHFSRLSHCTILPFFMHIFYFIKYAPVCFFKHLEIFKICFPIVKSSSFVPIIFWLSLLTVTLRSIMTWQLFPKEHPISHHIWFSQVCTFIIYHWFK